MKKASVFSNFLWRLAERFGAQGVTLIVSIVLARLLEPSVYGELALVTVFTSIMQLFVDSGLGTALVQKKDADDVDFSTVFIFNMCLCVVLYIILFCFSGTISEYYKLPALEPVIKVLGLTIVVSGLKNVQHAYVARNMLFRKFFFATLGGTIGAAIIGIYMAYNGYGIWALVAQHLFNNVVDTIVLWITVKWRPKAIFSFSRLKGLISFGWKLLAVSIVSTLYDNLRALIIGKKYSTEDLALYNKADQFPQLAVNNVNIAIDSILLPTMSRSQEDFYTIKKMISRSIKIGTYIMMPLMCGLAVCAKPFIVLILSEKWIGCVPYLQIFCFTYAFYSVFTTHYNAYKAVGRTDLYLKITVLSKIIGIVIIILAMNYGVMVIAYSLILYNLINQILCTYPSRRLFNYSIKEQFFDMMPNILISVVMGVPVYLVNFLNLKPIFTLLIQVPMGIAIYITLSHLTQNDSYNYVLKMIQEFFQAKKQKKEMK